jgi:hypothetical protein
MESTLTIFIFCVDKKAQYIYTAQNWRDKAGKIIDNNILLSRITFDGNDEFKESRLVYPLALTAITYLEGNPDIHIIGCGLKDEVE